MVLQTKRATCRTSRVGRFGECVVRPAISGVPPRMSHSDCHTKNIVLYARRPRNGRLSAPRDLSDPCTKSPSMDGREAMPRNHIHMKRRAIPFVARKIVFWILNVICIHYSVPSHLCDDGGKGDRKIFFVTLYECLLWIFGRCREPAIEKNLHGAWCSCRKPSQDRNDATFDRIRYSV